MRSSSADKRILRSYLSRVHFMQMGRDSSRVTVECRQNVGFNLAHRVHQLVLDPNLVTSSAVNSSRNSPRVTGWLSSMFIDIIVHASAVFLKTTGPGLADGHRPGTAGKIPVESRVESWLDSCHYIGGFGVR